MYHYPTPGTCNPVIQPSGFDSCGSPLATAINSKPDPRQPNGVVNSYVDSLASELERLEKAITGLEVRLCSVLRATASEAACGTLSPPSLDSPLAGQVRRIDGTIARIHEITERVQA